eukprot:s5574_g5.t1
MPGAENVSFWAPLDVSFWVPLYYAPTQMSDLCFCLVGTGGPKLRKLLHLQATLIILQLHQLLTMLFIGQSVQHMPEAQTAMAIKTSSASEFASEVGGRFVIAGQCTESDEFLSRCGRSQDV